MDLAKLAGVSVEKTPFKGVSFTEVHSTKQIYLMFKTKRIQGAFHVYPDDMRLTDYAIPLWKLEVFRSTQTFSCNDPALVKKFFPWFERNISRIKKDGTLKKLFEKHFGPTYDSYIDLST